MQIVVAFIHILVLATFSFWFWKRESSSLKNYFWPALTIKVFAGIALGLLYRHYYTVGDTFQYFEDGTKLAALARDDAKTYFDFLWSSNESFGIWSALALTEPRALFLIKIVSMFSVVTLDNYWIISVYFSVVSFYGAWLLVKQILALNQSYKNAAILALLFFPSVVFWSSGLIKESLAIACLFFLCSLFLKNWRTEKLIFFEWVFMVITLWLLWNLKYYYLAVFLPIALTSLVFKNFVLPILATKKLFIRLMFWLLMLVVPVVAISFVRPNFYPERFLHVIVSNNQAFTERSDPKDAIHYFDLQPNPLSVLKNSPWALFSGLFRPFIWESHTVFQVIVAVENSVIFLLTLTSLFRLRSGIKSSYWLLVFSIVTYAIVLCIFLALSTPNFGTLARYKVGFMPLFLLVILIDNPILSRISSFYQRSISNLVR
jgi:hypothetical protein